MTSEAPRNPLEVEKENNKTREERAIIALRPLREGYENLLRDKGEQRKLNKLRFHLAKTINKGDEAIYKMFGLKDEMTKTINWSDLRIFRKEIGDENPVIVIVENGFMPGNTIRVTIEGHPTELRLKEDLFSSHVFLGPSNWRDLDDLDMKYYSDLLNILQN